MNTIPRHQVIFWRIIKGVLLVRSELPKRGIMCNTICSRCQQKEKTIYHIFLSCPIAIKSWFGSVLSITFSNIPDIQFRDWLFQTIPSIDYITLSQIAAYGKIDNK
jgi:hypothetical protein